MKVLIDISERVYNEIKDDIVPSREDTVILATRISEGTAFPSNLTNGDMIMAMFPGASVYKHGSTYSINNEYNFNETWWESPFENEE